MPAIDTFVAEIRQELLQNLTPSPAKRREDLETNDFGQTRFGPDGTIVLGYMPNQMPLAIRVVGADEDMSIFTSVVCREIRTITGLDLATAQRYAEILDHTFPFAAEDQGRRRIRRVAGSGQGRLRKGLDPVPEGFTRDLRTGEIRPKKKAGRKPGAGSKGTTKGRK